MAAIDTNAKAVIFPAHTVSGYGHIYSLGIAGVPVTALSSADCSNFRSRYVREKFVVPNPYTDHERFVAWLVDYGRRQAIKPVLFLAEDFYAYLASFCQKQLRPFYNFPYIPGEKLDALFDKRAMYRTAAKAGLVIPKSLFSPASKEALDLWSCYPAVVKPAVSRFTFNGSKLLGVCDFPKLFGAKAVLCAGPQELANLTGRLRHVGLEYCVQEYIPGENHNLHTVYFVADRDGKIPSFSTHYKVRQYPADFGTTSVSQSVELPQLRDFAEQFCKCAGYTGPATMEFKLGAHDGAWYLMEINPRLGFAIRRSTVKGVNMVLQQYLLSTGQELLTTRQRDDGRFWIDVQGDMKSLLWRRARTRWHLPLWHIVKPFFFFREAVFNVNDPLPGIDRWRVSLLRAARSRLAGVRGGTP